jgi:hypothetical protein
MAKRKPRTPDNRGPLQRMIDRQALEQEQSHADIIPPEQRAKGGYEGDKRIVNTGGTPVARWAKSGKLSQTQCIAIEMCIRLWAITGTEQRTTANYGEIYSGSAAESENGVERYLDAKMDLSRLHGYFRGLEAWWQVFENVCRFDEPAGVAGSRLGFGSRSAEDRAHTTVCFVADIIATNERLIPNTRIRS